jgi:hypothetical protein
VRKRGILESTWNEYRKIVLSAIPPRFYKYIFTRKAVCISLGVIAIEVIVMSAVYFIWVNP